MSQRRHDFRGGVVFATPTALPSALQAALYARQFPVQPLDLNSVTAEATTSPVSPRVAIIGTGDLPDAPNTPEGVLAGLVGRGFALILIGASTPAVNDKVTEQAFIWLPLPLEEAQLLTAIRGAFAAAAAEQERDAARATADLKTAEAQSLYEIGTALSAERNIERLQELILQRARELTRADAGSLYLVDENPEKERILRFEIAQNDSVRSSFRKLTMPLTEKSIAGYVALTGRTLNLADAYQLPPGEPFGFNDAFDRQTGYRTKSMLVVPMRNHEGDVIGVVQLINRKRDFQAMLAGHAEVEHEVEAFPAEAEQVVDSFASQAAVALDNRLLLESIEQLFEGFVRASVSAIEARDPTTSGHSERVAELTVGIAQTVSDIGTGHFRDIGFSEKELREIRYAGLLHDFGKIGVREHVLIKAKKLFDWQLDVIRLRFALLRKSAETEYERRQLALILEQGQEGWLRMRDALEREHEHTLTTLDQELAVILEANEPTILDQDAVARLGEIGARRFDLHGVEQPILGDEEVLALSVRRGSLTEEERREIESHVSHTFKFLSLMPWTRQLKQVPLIAWSHHEKLDGTGYPQGLKGDEIPIQSRMMTIADIYDALTASDRPYKRAVPVPKALDILHDEVKRGALDPELLDVFVQRRVFEIVTPPNGQPVVPQLVTT
jgi:HD-GYP domain-containing protein (c-di-GMP phosphodiesterase class II)